MLTPKELNTLKTVLSVMRSPIQYGGDVMFREKDILKVLDEFTEDEVPDSIDEHYCSHNTCGMRKK